MDSDSIPFLCFMYNLSVKPKTEFQFQGMEFKRRHHIVLDGLAIKLVFVKDRVFFAMERRNEICKICAKPEVDSHR